MSIGQRAKRYVDNSLYDNSVTRKQYSYRGYVRGAIEQQEVDIINFCKCCEDYCIGISKCDRRARFIKMMEE